MANTRHAGRKKALTPDTINDLYNLRQAGTGMAELADMAGVSRQTLSTYFAAIKGRDYIVEISSGNSNNLLCRTLAYWKLLNANFIASGRISEAELAHYTLKYDYMNRDELMSEILVNLTDQKILVINHSSDIIHLAFGVNLLPNWDDFMDFLRERCFPEGRDRIREVLNYYGLDSFDAFALIEETGGVMAEDHQWLKVTHFGQKLPHEMEAYNG